VVVGQIQSTAVDRLRASGTNYIESRQALREASLQAPEGRSRVLGLRATRRRADLLRGRRGRRPRLVTFDKRLAHAVQSHLGIEELGSIRDSRKTQSLELHFRALLTEGSAKVLVHRDASDSIGGVLDERSTTARIEPQRER
jgi:hypothetical protein